MVRYPKLEPNPIRSWLLNARLRRSGALRSQACKGIPGAATTWVGRVTVALFCLVCLIWTTKNYPKLDFGQPTSRKPSELFGPDSWGRPDWRTRGVDAFKAVDRAHFWIRGRACGGVCETTRTRRRICEVELLRIVSATYVLFFPHEYQQNRRTIYNGVVYNIYIYTHVQICIVLFEVTLNTTNMIHIYFNLVCEHGSRALGTRILLISSRRRQSPSDVRVEPSQYGSAMC
jgi:hypothetical protein